MESPNRTSSSARSTARRTLAALGVALGSTLFAPPTVNVAMGMPETTKNSAPAADTLPPQLADIGIDQNLNAQLPLDAVFTDDYGQPVRIGDLFNAQRKRPAVLVMVYYECPMLCNMVLNDLLRTMNGMTAKTVGVDFDVVTVSINPNEKPELAAKKKRAYLKEYGQRGNPKGWHFLTGTEENIKKVAGTVGFRYRYDPVYKEYIHASGIMVVTTDGRLARYFYGVDYSPKDLRLSLAEASDDKIGDLTSQVLLYCFHYDPTTGKYGAVVANMLKLGGGLTLLVLGTFLLVMFRRERRPALRAVGGIPVAAGANDDLR